MDRIEVSGDIRYNPPADVIADVHQRWFGDEYVSFVAEDFDLTIDYGVPEVDIEPGAAFITNSEEVVKLSPFKSHTLPLDDSDTNTIYVRKSVRGIEYVSVTPSEEVPSDSVKIGEIDTTENKSRNVFKGPKIHGLPSEDLNGIYLAREQDGYDILDACNRALEEAGEDGTVWVEPKEYTKENGSAVSTQLQSQAPNQTVNFNGADVELADNVDQEIVVPQHNGFSLERVLLMGNRDNNTIPACFNTPDGGNLREVEIHRCDAEDTPVGFRMVDVEDCVFSDIRTEYAATSLDIAIQVEDSLGVQIQDNVINGFKVHAVQAINCDSVIANIIVRGSGNGAADSALNTQGCIDSQFKVIVESDGEVRKGVLSEAYDPGGTDEQISDNNIYELNISGFTEIGYHSQDANTENVRGSIDGSYGDGNVANQAFLIEKPNGIGTPSHNIDLSIQDVDRVTDTSLTGVPQSIELRGYLTQIQNTSNVILRGDSTIDFRFGNGVAKPAFITGSDTVVESNVSPRREVTDGSGQVMIDWSDFYHFTDVPVLVASLQSNNTWYISSLNTDADGNYTDAVIQVTDLSGAAVGSGVNVQVKLIGT